MQIKSAKDLIIYEKADELAMEIFEHSEIWPAEEKEHIGELIIYHSTDHALPLHGFTPSTLAPSTWKFFIGITITFSAMG